MRIASKYAQNTALKSNLCDLLSTEKSCLISQTMWAFLRRDAVYLILRPAIMQYFRVLLHHKAKYGTTVSVSNSSYFCKIFKIHF
jgi:hypothetical protein